ncbi:hypothetical protein [Nonomuraea sp. B19D2]|uniref:hypothetical protein n=1 Tax=Nonomuraea sp. B19D2 TaxID=3159561 RepID=UPI0032DBD162
MAVWNFLVLVVLLAVRNRRAGPVERSNGPYETAWESWTEASAPYPYDHTVRVEFESPPEDAELVPVMCGSRGWRVRRSTDGSRFQVDVPIAGSRIGALTAGTRHLLRSCVQDGVFVRIRWTHLRRPPGNFDARYRVFDSLTGRPVDGEVHARSVADAEALANSRTTEFNGRRLLVRKAVGESSEDELRRLEARHRSAKPPRAAITATGGAFSALAPLVGGVLLGQTWPRQPWTAVALVVVVASVIPCRWLLRSWLLGSMLPPAMAFVGWTLAADPPPDVVRLAGLALITPITIAGVRYFFHYTSLKVALSWLLPMLVTIAIPLPMVYGQLTYETYLSVFGLGADDVELPWWQALQPAWSLTGLTLLLALVSLAIVGWGYHVNLIVPLWVVTFVTLFALMVAVLVPCVLGIQEGYRSGVIALRELRATGTTTAFHGVEPKAVCLVPVTEKIAFKGAAPVPSRPLVLFGDANGRAALWDRVGGALTVKEDDVQLASSRHWDRC